MSAGQPDTLDPDLLDRVRAALASSGRPATAAHVADLLRRQPGLRAPQAVLGTVTALRAALTGAGPLQALFDDPEVSDVLVQRGGEVWVDKGGGLTRSNLRLDGEDAVRRLATRLVAAAGRRLDPAQPWADARLADGHRLHAIIPPLAVDGTCLSLRLLRPAQHDLGTLAAAGALPGNLEAWLRAMLQARLSICVTGATGSGKTTLLGALVGALDPSLRVLVVEDATELAPRHPHVLRLQARPANIEGAGLVSLRDLVRQALRMRPDRLVLGEVRGAEVVDLLVASNTGHEGGLSTLHANSPQEVPARIEALGALAGLPRPAVHSLLAPALQAVVHLARSPAGRRVQEVAVTALDEGVVHCRAALTVAGGGGRLERGPGLPALRELLDSRGVAPPPVG